jgi:hypothetical protein
MKQAGSRARLAYSSTLKLEATSFFQKSRFTFTDLHGVISQKIEFFIITAVRASNLARYEGFLVM